VARHFGDGPFHEILIYKIGRLVPDSNRFWYKERRSGTLIGTQIYYYYYFLSDGHILTGQSAATLKFEIPSRGDC